MPVASTAPKVPALSAPSPPHGRSTSSGGGIAASAFGSPPNTLTEPVWDTIKVLKLGLTALLSPFSGMLFSSYNLPLPGHILICGPPGSGKTLLAKVSTKLIEACNDILAHIVFASCSNLTLEKPATIRQALSGYISEALDHAPSLIILDDLDSVIASSSNLEGSQPSPSSVALTEFLADILDEYEARLHVADLLQAEKGVTVSNGGNDSCGRATTLVAVIMVNLSLKLVCMGSAAV